MAEPKLEQSVQWREQYVSAALNRKLSGIVFPGVYKGFHVLPGEGFREVRVSHGEDGRSVAVVDRGPYSITVTMTDEGTVTIPATGTWYICIEAYYQPNATGYQRIVCKSEADVLSHHVVLAKVVLRSASVRISQEDIDDSMRNMGWDERLRRLQLSDTRLGKTLVLVSDRLTKVELKLIGGGGSGGGGGAVSGDVELEIVN